MTEHLSRNLKQVKEETGWYQRKTILGRKWSKYKTQGGGNMFKEQTKDHCGWMEVREGPSMDEDSDHTESHRLYLTLSETS